MPALKPTVGLEIHVRLDTGRKLFCACSFRFGGPPNSQVCPVCLGLPGSLPVLDPEAVTLALRAGAALGAGLNPVSEFARKNYFYPDLPRNYQITQYDCPLFSGGLLDNAATGGARVRLQRLHLEEDAGRSVVPAAEEQIAGTATLVDLNRAGTPLLEIVTEPDLAGGDQARGWLQGLLLTLQYCGVCAGNMAEGDLRCDANVGLQGEGEGPLTEIKNLNSFRHLAQAVDHEIERLGALVARGDIPRVTTRSWDAPRRRTAFLRDKEQSRDYRYFPEPDLPLLQVRQEEYAAAAAALPELPHRKQLRLEQEWGLDPAEARALCRERTLAGYWQEVAAGLREEAVDQAGRMAAHWILGPVLSPGRDASGVSGREDDPAGWPAAPFLVELLLLLHHKSITARVARRILERRLLAGDGRDPAEMVAQEGWGQIRDSRHLDLACREILAENPGLVRDYLAGKTAVLKFMLGQVMQRTAGRADPETTRQALLKMIENSRG